MPIARPPNATPQRMATPDWHVLGAGSIGCLFAAALRRAGVSIHLLLRDAAALAAWRRAGGAIALQDDTGLQRIELPAATAATLDCAPIRQLLVCTKAQQTHTALAALGAAVDPAALIVLLQNGMGVREQLQALLPGATILQALSTEGAYQTARFHVVHAGRGETVIGGSGDLLAIAQETARALRCELRIDAVDDIERRSWLKLAVNSVINPLTALHDCTNGEVLALPDIDALLPALCVEACAAASAEGQQLQPAQVAEAVRAVCRATAANRSSMLQDVTARRLTEIDFINGHVVRTAQRHGIPCPQQSTLLARIKSLERHLGCR